MKRRDLLSWLAVFLLAAAPAAILWLPVPNFLFASGDSGGSGGGCSCTALKCEEWKGEETAGLDCARHNAEWELCTQVTAGDDIPCIEGEGQPERSKRMPKSTWTYEDAPYCADGNEGDALTSEVVWSRCVHMTPQQSQGGNVTLKFAPEVRLIHTSWDPANVCGNSDHDDFVRGYGMVYAKMKACGDEKCDKGKTGNNRNIQGQIYGQCWWIGDFTLQYVNNAWRLTPALNEEIKTTFAVSDECGCYWENADCADASNEDAKKRAAEQVLQFRAAVVYGSTEQQADWNYLRMGAQASIVLKANSDTTECKPK